MIYFTAILFYDITIILDNNNTGVPNNCYLLNFTQKDIWYC